jgi:anaerobic magnesium-protoporphyrin IX monomethyl ester cyclase
MRHTVILYNPISTSPGKQRLPMSLLSVAAVIADDYDLVFIDGNLIADPAAAICAAIERTGARLVGVTVMPGPQLRQAVRVCKQVKAAHPQVAILWGGYFVSNHPDVTVQADFVDYGIIGQGEPPFRALVDTLHYGGSLDDVPSLVYDDGGTVKKTLRAPYADVNRFPWYPYDQIDVTQYIGSSYLGQRVLSHHTSFGCPFSCSFCAVVPLAQKRWLAESAERVGEIVGHMKQRWHVDGIEFHDMDFFIREDRAREIAERIAPYDVNWWGLGRVDNLTRYSDQTWRTLADSGLKMVFMGAETGSDETLKQMNKGGTSSTDKTLAIVERMKGYGVVPELSFVMGNPPDPVTDVEHTIQFIRKIKRINPATELILYIYTPVPQEGSIMTEAAYAAGFRFPDTLEEWASEEWSQRSLRRDPGTPWFTDSIRRKVRDFEAVVNAYYPTVTDVRLRGTMRKLLRGISGVRYQTQAYTYPLELKFLQRLIRYRRPETTGF